MNAPAAAKDIMVTRLFTVTPKMDIHEAIDLLLHNRISGAPVVNESYHLVGMLSEKDCMNVLVKGAYDNLPTTSVDAFMRTEVKTISPNLDLLSIAQFFLTTSYRRLPVVNEENYLLGQISRRDILRATRELLTQAEEPQKAFLYLSRVANREDAPIA